ncbi:MAG TPA: glycosyltransferase family 2 protein [Tepidisphaeraceae bacterium]|nr:glycosyltransferase family 2 protein [Tepidisphaeraceae bacterium]
MTLWVLAAALLAPIAVFTAQCWAALLPALRGRDAASQAPAARPPVAVLVPAHNEQALLGQTLAALKPQLRAGDLVLVVADNCTDDTAEIARAGGARVLERRDASRRGKGYALSAGLDALSNDAFEVLLVLDADCHIEPGALDALAAQVAATGRPAQAVYLMEQCERPTPRDHISTWAFMVKNLVRPIGLSRLGLPCQLTGTGMAFPRAALAKVSLASGNIVEDMQLGLDLALAGTAPRLCPDAHVTGRLPRDRAVALKQRQRWEHGHLRTLLVQAPRLAVLGLIRCRPAAVAMALDLLVPPLSLLLVLSMGTLAVAVAAIPFGAAWHPAAALAIGMTVLLATVLTAWAKFGRACLPARSLFAAAAYVAWKLPMYAMFLFRPEKKWVRTERTAPPATTP